MWVIFWRFLDLPLINCEIELDLSWSKDCIISGKSRTPEIDVDPDANPSILTKEARKTNNATFQINNTKLYVPVGTLLIKDNIKFLENIKQGFKRKVFWNKYRSEIITKPKTTIWIIRLVKQLIILIDCFFFH